MTEETDLEEKGVLRLRQTSLKLSEAISYCFIPFRIKSQGCQIHRQKTASVEKKKIAHQVQTRCDVLKGLKEAGILRASDDGGATR